MKAGDIESEVAALHNTCWAYEREIARNRAAIRALTERWRKEAANFMAPDRDPDDGVYAAALERCADDLAALYPVVQG